MADLTTVYGSTSLLGAPELNGAEVLYLTSPHNTTAVMTYYKLAGWVAVPNAGPVEFRLAGTSNARLTIDGEYLTQSFFTGLVIEPFELAEPKILRFDLQYTVFADNIDGYAGFEVVQGDQLVFQTSTSNTVGAITLDEEDNLTDEQLGPPPDLFPPDINLALPVFPFDPNWRYEVSDTLTWLTDIMSSESDAEQRMRLRPLPRRTVEATFSHWSMQRQQFNMFMSGVGRDSVLLPLWWDRYSIDADITEDTEQLEGGPIRLEFRPDQIVQLKSDNGEALATTLDYVDGVLRFKVKPTAALSGRVSVTPLAVGRFMDDSSRNNLTAGVQETRIQFTDYNPAPVAGEFDPSVGGDVPVFLKRPNYSSGLVFDYSRQNYIMDNQISLPSIEKNTDSISMRLRATYHCHSRPELDVMQKRIWAMQGRYKAFRLPTYTDDITLADAIFNAQEALRCEPFGYTDSDAITQDVYRYILIQLWDGRNFIREIISSEVLSGVEWLYLNQSIGTIGRDEVRQICFVPTARLDTDAIEFTRLTDDKVTVALTFKLFDNRRESSGGEFDLTYLVSSDDFYLISFDDLKLAGAD